MSSNKDKIRDWFFALPPETRERIDSQIENIRNQEDVTERHEQTLRKMVKELARTIEPLVDDPSQISAIIKAIANGRISDETIEKALPKEKKRKYDRYQDLEIRNNTDFQQPVTVSSDGSESYDDGEPDSKPDWTEGKDIEIKEIGSAYNREIQEYEVKLNEALTLADDKDKRIYELEMKQGELEMEMEDLKKKPVRKESDIEKIEELQIENDNLKLRLREVEEIERTRIKESGFSTASRIPKHPWIAAIDALPFYITLRRARDYAINNNDPWRKILFDAGEDGKLSNARLEGENA